MKESYEEENPTRREFLTAGISSGKSTSYSPEERGRYRPDEFISGLALTTLLAFSAFAFTVSFAGETSEDGGKSLAYNTTDTPYNETDNRTKSPAPNGSSESWEEVFNF